MEMHAATRKREGHGFTVRHKKCGGQVAVEGTVRHRMPLGFGFVGAKFGVDVVERKGWVGFCLECRANGAFFTPQRGRAKTIRVPRVDAAVRGTR